jgi:hypothetical protein
VRVASAPAPFGQPDFNMRYYLDKDRETAPGGIYGGPDRRDLIAAATPAGIAFIASTALSTFQEATPWDQLSRAQRERRIADVESIIRNPDGGPYPTPWGHMAHAIALAFLGEGQVEYPAEAAPPASELNDYGRPIDSIQTAPRGAPSNRFFNGEIVECRETQGNCLLRFDKRFTAPDGDTVNLLYLDPQDHTNIGANGCWAPDSELHSIGQQRFVVLQRGAGAHSIVEVIAGDANVTEGTIYRTVTQVPNEIDARMICEGLELQYRQVQAKMNGCGLAGSDQQLAAA